MARTINTIYQEIITERNNHPELIPSKILSLTALMSLLMYVIAVCIFSLETLWDAFRDEITDIANSEPVGTLPWYVKKSLEFQYGDALVWEDNQFKYHFPDISKTIIARAAAVDYNRSVLIKVAALNSGSPAPLSTLQLGAFKAYIKKVKIPGIVNIISYPADSLKVGFRAYYDPMLIYLNTANPADALNGSLLSDSSQFPVMDAINAYLNELEFNGVVNLTKLIDSIQAASGIIDIVPVSSAIQAKTAGAAYAAIVDNYQTVAGYIQLDAGQSYINYCDPSGNVLVTVTF